MQVKNNVFKEYDYEEFYFAHRFNIYNKKDVLSKHIHDCYEIIFVKKGQFKYYYEDSSIIVEDGDLLITPPHVYHYFEASNTSSCERYILLVKSDELQKLISVLEPSKLNIFDKEILYSTYDRFDYYSENSYKDSVSKNLKQITTLLVMELLVNLANEEFDTDKKSFSNPILSSILKYVNENLEDIPTTNVLIDKFNISESYLHKLFKKYLKITPKKYLILKKMSLAKKLIGEGQLLTNIARQCGFSSYTAFYRTFLDYYKVPPAKMLGRNEKNKPL